MAHDPEILSALFWWIILFWLGRWFLRWWKP